MGLNGGIVIVALRRIEPGEEITYDYGREYLKYFFENDGCRCALCRKKAARHRRGQKTSNDRMGVQRPPRGEAIPIGSDFVQQQS